MALVHDLSRAQLAFQVAGGDVDRFDVIRYRGTEGLCQLYRFEIELASAEREVAFDEIVGKPASLSIDADNGQRYFHGIVSRFEMTDETTDQCYYRAELVPTVWLLTHRYNSRIFQGKTVPEIITDVLNKGGIPSDRYNLAGVTGEYKPQEYRVQYRETDYNFICRLMEEQGMFWYFTQSREGHVLMIADSTSGYAPIDGEQASLPYASPTGMNVEQEHVYRFRLGQSVRPGKVALTDYNFENPALDLSSSGGANRDQNLEFYDYPGEYIEQSRGQNVAALRAEEFEAGRIHAIGKSNSPRLSPGKTFELTDHPSAPLNLQYLITAVTHQGKQSTTRTSTGGNGQAAILSRDVVQSLMQIERGENASLRDCARALLHLAQRVSPADETAHRAATPWLYHGGQVNRDPSTTAMAMGGNPLDPLATPNLMEDVSRTSNVDRDAPVYECRFECIPATVSYRPARVTPWPVVRGAQVAHVTGPEGEEIYPDKYGRVKVKFPWDREGKHDENSSCWIRVSQGMAGGQYGIMFLPRVGQEVVVDFLEGNPDKPLITGRVYNSDQMPPYQLPKEKTKSVIKTRSSTGGGGTNEIRFEDLKDKEQILIYAQKDLHIRAKNDRIENIENDRHLTVGNDRFEEVQNNYHLEVKEGDINVEIGGNESLAVKGKASIKVDGTHSTNVGGNVVYKFGANHKHDVKQTYAAKALNIKLEASTGIELKCGGSSIVLTPAAIFIVGGPLVNINSGSGPPVGPVTAQATSPEAPEAPKSADEVQPGQDIRYDGTTPEEPADETPATQKTWISIELRDENGNPIANEPYEITSGDGKVHKGTLDRKGKAKIGGIDPGTCQVTFPEIHGAEWKQI
ncbi:MAG: type VI secretion system Vgr family protein [Phycisphaerae bacterium]